MVKIGLIINLLISLLLIQQTLQLEPFITEYIVPFDIPMDDLKTIASNQLSRNQFKTNTFTTDNVTVSKLIFKTTYNGTGKIINPQQQSTFHTVWNDNVDLVVTYQADIHKLPTTKKTFNGTTKLKVYLNYTKKIIPESESTDITGVQVVVDKNSFEMSFTGNPNESEKKKLEQVNNGVVSGKKNTTIFSLLQAQEFTKQIILSFFKENLVNQKISPTYQSTYRYQFNNLTIMFDMTTAGLKTIPHGIAHELKGTIKDYNSERLPSLINAPYEEGFHTLFSVSFLNYFMSYNTQKNPNWYSFKLNKNTFKTSLFKFRLIDLELFFPKLTKKYAQYFLNYISIICSPLTFNNWILDEGKSSLKVSMVWLCKGNLEGPASPPQVLNFEASIDYLAELTLYSDNIEVYVTTTDLKSLDFQPIDGEQVEELQYAMIYSKEIVDKLIGFAVGSSFRVKKNSSKIMVKENIGIYVG